MGFRSWSYDRWCCQRTGCLGLGAWIWRCKNTLLSKMFGTLSRSDNYMYIHFSNMSYKSDISIYYIIHIYIYITILHIYMILEICCWAFFSAIASWSSSLAFATWYFWCIIKGSGDFQGPPSQEFSHPFPVLMFLIWKYLCIYSFLLTLKVQPTKLVMAGP